MKARQSGFTLVEIAIVLVIIGLLLGGVLKGQSLIASAKYKNLNSQAQSIETAVYAYQDKYKYLPGDDPQFTTRGCTVPTGFTAAKGNGNGQITEYTSSLVGLVACGFMTGTLNTANGSATHVLGGPVYLYYQTIQGKTGNLVRFDNLTDEYALQLDQALDDGKYNSGTIRGSADYSTSAPTGTVIANTAVFF